MNSDQIDALYQQMTCIWNGGSASWNDGCMGIGEGMWSYQADANKQSKRDARADVPFLDLVLLKNPQISLGSSNISMIDEGQAATIRIMLCYHVHMSCWPAYLESSNCSTLARLELT